jgi:hypothetical protein
MGKLGYTGRLLRELLGFARAHKAYWIVPLAIILLLAVGVIVLGQTAAPFIYTLF